MRERRHVKQNPIWGKDGVWNKTQHEGKTACETKPNMRERQQVKQNPIWGKDSKWNKTQYEGKTACETKPNIRERRHVKQNPIWGKDGVLNKTQYEGKTVCETKPNMRERRHVKQNLIPVAVAKHVNCRCYITCSVEILSREKSWSQSSTFGHIREKHGFHFLTGKLRNSSGWLVPQTKLIG